MGKFDPSLENSLNLHIAALTLQQDFLGSIKGFISYLQQPENQQLCFNLLSPETVTTGIF